MENYQYIVVEGNIGVGKTSFVDLFYKEFKYHKLYENFKNNPFLADFYNDDKSNIFQMESYFLVERYKQLINLHNKINNNIISDFLFSKSLLFAEINLSKSEFKLFKVIFDQFDRLIKEPDLMIFLSSDINKISKQIRQRDRFFEKKISRQYLEKVNIGYEKLLELEKNKFPILCFDVTNIDFIDQKPIFKKILTYLNKSYSKGIHNISL
ncbi:MAG: hypothetical protein CBE48_001170 [Flavobacteriales bacterium TMED288]|nr:hypothetical protein [Flavobacteriales bacterium]RPG53443.1 MAG: hypothetical protein CBE48_001170 [Flavobacteriales bacterium TMED288]|tara:strand:+ start:24371 stop:25000 length:630 start_codon:yes stop_codon:yes gene_type:complete